MTREETAVELLREAMTPKQWGHTQTCPCLFCKKVRAFLATPREEPKRTEDRMTMSIRIMDAEWCLTCRAPMLQLSREERPDVYDGPCRCEPLAPAEPQEERYTLAQVDALTRFKEYVHKRLDDAGVPVDPESPHKANGCRIGGRLDWVLSAEVDMVARAEAAEREAAALREALEKAERRASLCADSLGPAETALGRCMEWLPDVSEFEGAEQEEHLTKTHEWTERALRMLANARAALASTPAVPVEVAKEEPEQQCIHDVTTCHHPECQTEDE